MGHILLSQPTLDDASALAHLQLEAYKRGQVHEHLWGDCLLSDLESFYTDNIRKGLLASAQEQQEEKRTLVLVKATLDGVVAGLAVWVHVPARGWVGDSGAKEKGEKKLPAGAHLENYSEWTKALGYKAEIEEPHLCELLYWDREAEANERLSNRAREVGSQS